MLADRIVARDTRMRAEELGTVLDLQAWLGLHRSTRRDPFATGIAGGAGRRSGSDGTPMVDEFAVREYAALRHQSEPTARAFMIDVADLEHRFPKLWAAVQALWLPVWQARKIVAACRELSQHAAALVDAEMAAVVAGLPWSRILTKLAAAIMQADPVLAEKKRQQAKSARFVQLCRSEDGINTMIVRADQGDLVMVYALVDRLADILALEGNIEPADERRATAFGLLAQPAMILEMLLRHQDDGTTERCHASEVRPPPRSRTTHPRRRSSPGTRRQACRGGPSISVRISRSHSHHRTPTPNRPPGLLRTTTNPTTRHRSITRTFPTTGNNASDPARHRNHPPPSGTKNPTTPTHPTTTNPPTGQDCVSTCPDSPTCSPSRA